MKLLTKILLITVVILTIFFFLLRGYVKESEDIASKVGTRIGGGELSMTDYYSLAQLVETYNDYLISGEYETAYKMVNGLYRFCVPYEEYLKIVSKRNNQEMHIASIEQVTASTYHIVTDVEEEQVEYSLVMNQEQNNISFFPESFLDYKEIGEKQSKKGLKCILEAYKIMTNQNEFSFEMENTSREAITIKKVILKTNNGTTLSSQEAITIPAKSTQKETILFTTDYDFPQTITLVREEGEKTPIEYVFELEK